jgi:hypothetical protein
MKRLLSLLCLLGIAMTLSTTLQAQEEDYEYDDTYVAPSTTPVQEIEPVDSVDDSGAGTFVPEETHDDGGDY